MRTHRISDDDALALVKGEASAARPDLAPLAESIASFRMAAFASPVRPSAELTARLELEEGSGISQGASPAWRADTIEARTRVTDPGAPVLGRVKKMFAWFTGLGIAMKVVLGVTVAAAASATGVGAVVAYNGIAPTFEQEQVTPTDEPTSPGEETSDPTDAADTFGTWVSGRAHELGKDSDGAAFGEETSEQAQQLGDEHAHNSEGTDPAEGGENAENGTDHAPDLPDVTPGGDDSDD